MTVVYRVRDVNLDAGNIVEELDSDQLRAHNALSQEEQETNTNQHNALYATMIVNFDATLTRQDGVTVDVELADTRPVTQLISYVGDLQRNPTGADHDRHISLAKDFIIEMRSKGMTVSQIMGLREEIVQGIENATLLYRNRAGDLYPTS